MTDLERSIADEWLVTNGLGGYAMGTAAGIPTRSYHGLLIVARRPPVERTVLVAGLLERAGRPGRQHATLSTFERPDGSLAGDESDRAARCIGARLDGRQLVSTFEVDGATVERRVWMAQGSNTTYVRYALLDGAEALDLDIAPLLTERDHHAVRRHAPGEPAPAGVRVIVDGADLALEATSVVRMRLREETARGLLDETDVLTVAPCRLRLERERPRAVVLTAEAEPPVEAEAALLEARRRDVDLLARAQPRVGADSAFVQRLVLGADAFIVGRDVPGIVGGRSIIAGYPWFNDWGRDTMIALPGLCLATGRPDDATTILRSFARYVRDGLIPNDFPDDPAVVPAYHTIDASLWFIRAVAATEVATSDAALVSELLPAVREILDRHLAGTRFGIGVDPDDGLLRGGADDVQLTWMDAKVDGWVVTPRRGKPVEIQALWVNALRDGARWTGASSYAAAAARAETSFRARFWRPELGFLADVLDGPDGDDLALRPNQLLALSLPHPLVDAAMGRSVLAAVERELGVPLGLRSLAPSDAAYRQRFQGDRAFRDAGYHQGTVWTWLIGPYADAVARFGGGASAARDVLRPFVAHLDAAGLGSISEILEPEPPFTPRGCPFQAWGVAEVLRAWRAHGGT
ncbi:MAG: amylo-alpha-1,6-glucosidase [Candidatus Limnocylindrales bacterium]